VQAPERRQALRALRDLALFALPVLGFLAWADARVAMARSDIDALREAFDRARGRVEQICLGSSHAAYGFAPERFGRPTLNLGSPSQSLAYDARLAEYALGRVPKLETVIWGISYFALRYELTIGPECRRAFAYERAFGFRPDLPWWRPERYSQIARAPDPWDALSQAVWQGPAGAYRKQPRLPGQLVDEPDPGRLTRANVEHRLNYWQGMMDASRVGANERWLDEAEARLKAHGVRTCFVLMPLSGGFLARRDPAVVAELRAAIARVAARAGALVLDRLDGGGFDPGDFRDVDHLGPAGAAKLSAEVDRALQNWK
jgi:hypothetical protein